MTTKEKTETLYRDAARLYVRYVNHGGPFWAEALLMDYLPANNPDGRVCDISAEQIPAFMDALRKQLDTPQETA